MVQITFSPSVSVTVEPSKIPPSQDQLPVVYPSTSDSERSYAVLAKTVSATPEPPLVLKLRSSFGTAAFADSVKSSATASPLLSPITLLTSLRVGG